MVLLARRLVPDVRADDSTPLDWRGFLLTAVGVAALVDRHGAVGRAATGLAFASSALGRPRCPARAAIGYLLRARRPRCWTCAPCEIRSLRAAAAGGPSSEP